MIVKASVMFEFSNSGPLEYILSDALLEEINKRMAEGNMPTGNSCLRLEFGPKAKPAKVDPESVCLGKAEFREIEASQRCTTIAHKQESPYSWLKPGDTCPSCGGILLLKDKTQYGPFIGCSNFRDKNCRFTIPLDKDDPEAMRRYREWKLGGITGFDKLPPQQPALIVHPAPIAVDPPDYSAEANQEVVEKDACEDKAEVDWL